MSEPINQPEAKRLADELERPVGTQSTYSAMQQAAAELRRLHAEVDALKRRLGQHDACNGVMGESGYVPECISMHAEVKRLLQEADERRKQHAEVNRMWIAFETKTRLRVEKAEAEVERLRAIVRGKIVVRKVWVDEAGDVQFELVDAALKEPK
jgi:hypothetical protein